MTATLTPNQSTLISVVRQTQPCPLASEDGSTGCYPTLMTMLGNHLSGSNSFDVTHAVPRSMDTPTILDDPSITPSAERSGSEDYFNLNVFPRIAFTPDPSTTLPSPRTIVPPASIHASIFERYIPPPTWTEYQTLFHPVGPSALVDRLLELSPHNGTLIFTYPTAQGAADFKNHFLHPLIDPLLRTLINIHGLSADFGPSITRTFAGANQLDHFPVLRSKMQRLMHDLNKKDLSTSASSGSGSAFTLAHSSTHTIPLPRRTWVPWWVSQEKPRIRKAIDAYYAQGRRVPDERVLSSGSLLYQVLDGLQARRYGSVEEEQGTQGEAGGVEVGMFVVVRSR